MEEAGREDGSRAREILAGVWPLVTAAEMQALDADTIGRLGVGGGVLMESAGRSLVAGVMALRAGGPRRAQPVRALCGAGNNGGDGFVVVRHLLASGVASEAVLIGDPDRLPEDAAANWRRLETIGAPRRVVPVSARSFDWSGLLSGSSVVVDALFGTGLTRPLEGIWAEIVRACNDERRRGLRVLAVDIPSGIAANSGGVLGAAIEADRTVTISLPKIGLALEPGAHHAGMIEVARIGIADPDPERVPRAEMWNERAAAQRLPARPRDGHKGRFGHVLVVAGSTGKTGAGVLASRAAARAGAGLVTLAHPSGTEAELASLPVEVMTVPLPTNPAGGLTVEAGEQVTGLAEARDVVALGPGLGLDPETHFRVAEWVDSIERPLVVDADGLNALVGRLDHLAGRGAPTVLTPHPGEAARLLGLSAAEINADRLAAARALAERSGAVVVLKGARTVVADPPGRVRIIPTGGPALATGGTGDVLTGIVAALLAARLEAFEAGSLAAWWHGAAADRRPEAKVGFGLLASDLADALPLTAAAMQEVAAKGGDPDDPLVLHFL